MPLRTTGLTIIEALVVIVIIVIVAAIATPIVNGVKRNAKISASISNMRQLYVSFQQYRNEYDGIDSYESFYAAGLPTSNYYNHVWMQQHSSLWLSPCGADSQTLAIPPISKSKGLITYTPTYYDPVHFVSGANAPLVDYLKTYRANAVVFLDINCNFTPMDAKVILNPFSEKLCLGITLGGQVINKLKRGSGDSLQFYSQLPGD